MPEFHLAEGIIEGKVENAVAVGVAWPCASASGADGGKALGAEPCARVALCGEGRMVWRDLCTLEGGGLAELGSQAVHGLRLKTQRGKEPGDVSVVALHGGCQLPEDVVEGADQVHV